MATLSKERSVCRDVRPRLDKFTDSDRLLKSHSKDVTEMTRNALKRG
jgi:hypothetical protein